MADIRDFIAAERQTNDALVAATSWDEELPERVGSRGAADAHAIYLAGRSIALAIREASVRADYVRAGRP